MCVPVNISSTMCSPAAQALDGHFKLSKSHAYSTQAEVPTDPLVRISLSWFIHKLASWANICLCKWPGLLFLEC